MRQLRLPFFCPKYLFILQRMQALNLLFQRVFIKIYLQYNSKRQIRIVFDQEWIEYAHIRFVMHDIMIPTIRLKN